MSREEKRRLSVFDYLDYRQYIKDYYLEKKKEKSSFSYQMLAKKAGFSSRSHVVMLIQGKRNLSGKSIIKFAKAMGLQKREKEYFENLVGFNQSEDPEEKKYYYEQLIFLHSKDDHIILSDREYQYLANWYVPVIREMVGQKGFRLDPGWITRKLHNRITLDDAERALKVLLKLGLIEKCEKNKYKSTGRHVVAPNTISDVVAYAYHDQMIDLSKMSLKGGDLGAKRDMSSMTLPLCREQLGSIRQHMKDFRKKVLHELKKETDSAKEIYQLNLHLFSLTKIKGDKI